MPSRVQAVRGCLYKLEVTNFKSYAGNLQIGPFKDFTCVIGPNGSGKSNLMDAVSFVMGVKTTDLRGAKVSDFRSHSAQKGDPNTSVTLYYHNDARRGEDEGNSEGEIRFTRTILPSDASEYRIDGRKVPEKEYQAKLKSVGLLVKSRNFLVFQNEVEKVAQKSPKELTELIERISGSEDYRADYESLQEKKKEGSDKVVGLYRRKELVHKELKQCKEAVKEANLYQRYCDDLKETKTQKALFEAFHLERQMEAHAKATEGHASKMQELEKACTVLNKRMLVEGKKKAEKQKEWASHDSNVEDMEKKIRSIQRSKIIKLQTANKSSAADLKQAENMEKEAAEKIKEVSKTLKSDEKLLGQHEADLKKEEADNVGKDIKLQDSQVSEYNRLKQQASAETQRAKAAFEKTQNAQQLDQRTQNSLEDDCQRLQDRMHEREAQVASDAGDKDQMSKEVQSLGHQKQKLESDLKDLDIRFKQEVELRKKLEDKNNHFESELRNAHADMNRSKIEDRNKKNVDTLKKTFSGVLGRVSDLCKVRQKAYDLAMAVVMENHLDSIVVDNTTTVQKCIEHLKEQKWHPMTFLPLDSITAKAPDQRLREIQDQRVKLALDLLEFDESVTKAMWYACGNTIVTDSLDQAKELAYGKDLSIRVKVVSKDGSLISKSGIMTGGDASIFDSKLRRWQASDTDKLKQDYHKNYDELQACRTRIEKLKNEMSTKTRDKDDADNKLKGARQRKESADHFLKTRTTEIETLKRQIKEKKEKIEKVKQKTDERAKQLDEEQKELNKINDRVFAAFCKDLGISNIAEYEGGSLAEVRERQEKLKKLTMLVEKLKAQIDKSKRQMKDLNSKKMDAEATMKSANEKLKENEKKMAEANTELKAAMDEKQELISKREEVKKETDAIEGEIKKFQTVLKKQTDERDDVARQSEQSEKSVERCRDDIQALLEQCKLDDIELPRKGQGKKRDRADQADEMEVDGEEGQDEDMEDSQEGESQGQSQVVDQARKELKTISLDYSKLSREQKGDLSEREQDRVSKDLTEKQNSISDRLQGMNPNMKASEQYKEIEERFNNLSEEWTVARKECDELSEEFERVKKERCDKFNKCFDHVMSCIDGIYKELTIDPAHGGSVGGSAYLTLNSQDEPYTSGIKYDTIPPGKRFMDMTHLSGGEKTVAALALLFAINSYNPAPFIVLDEVDAALDARNVAKVTRFIQSRRDEQQCVIISLKERFYEKADGLVGICRNHQSGHSNAFTLDLTLYDDSVAV